MNPVLKQQLEGAKKLGVSFDVLRDWDKLQELSALADAAMNCETASERAMLRPCVTIGNETFHRITIGASAWVDRIVREFGVDNQAWLIVLAFAMAHAKNPREKLWPLFADKERVQGVIDEWANGLGVDFKTLQEELLKFMEEGNRAESAKAGEPSQKKTGYGRLIDILCHEYGQTPEHWLWSVPITDIDALMSGRSKRISEEKKGAKADPNDPSVIAFHRLHVKMREFIDELKGK